MNIFSEVGQTEKQSEYVTSSSENVAAISDNYYNCNVKYLEGKLTVQ